MRILGVSVLANSGRIALTDRDAQDLHAEVDLNTQWSLASLSNQANVAVGYGVVGRHRYAILNLPKSSSKAMKFIIGLFSLLRVMFIMSAASSCGNLHWD